MIETINEFRRFWDWLILVRINSVWKFGEIDQVKIWNFMTYKRRIRNVIELKYYVVIDQKDIVENFWSSKRTKVHNQEFFSTIEKLVIIVISR